MIREVRWSPLVVGMVVACAWATRADAQCAPVPHATVGVTTERCATGDREWWIARVDLATGDLGLRVSRPSERGRTVTRWANETEGVVLALQAGDFGFPSYVPEGLTVGNGEPWSETADDARLAVLAFDTRGLGVYAPARQVVPAEPWMDAVLSGPSVLRGGVPTSQCEPRGCERRARTGVGLDERGRAVIAVVALGDREGRPGVTDPELGELLRDAGAHDGLRSGEGAWSVLWSQGEVVAPTSEGEPRPTAAFLGVVDRATGAETRFRGVVGVEGMPERALPMARLRVETLDGRLVAEGGTLTTAAYWEFTLPVREYIIRASHAGYRTGCKVCQGAPNVDVWCSLFLVEGSGAQVCEPPPRTLDVGPWPEGTPPGPDAGTSADAGTGEERTGGCAVGGPSPTPRGVWVLAPYGVVVVVRRVRRGVRGVRGVCGNVARGLRGDAK